MAQFLYALTSSNINRFSILFHCQNQEKMCNNTITKDPTTPQVCRYTVKCQVSCATRGGGVSIHKGWLATKAYGSSDQCEKSIHIFDNLAINTLMQGASSVSRCGIFQQLTIRKILGNLLHTKFCSVCKSALL